ncbi:MAG: ADP-ribosylglycohydrolase family protein [Verrucomicrobiota bacterium]
MSKSKQNAILGCLLGTAVGDSVGLPFEGLPRHRIVQVLKDRPLEQQLFLRRGMLSDDTEHTLMVAHRLQNVSDNPEAFGRKLAWSLRWWILGLPAGVGLSTARSIIRLWFGVCPSRSGVRSAGNGAAMRSAIFGVFFCDYEGPRSEFTRQSCLITHSDPRALEAADMASTAASEACRGSSNERIIEVLRSRVVSQEMTTRFEVIVDYLARSRSVQSLAEALGDGRKVSGFAPDTVSVALYAWLRHRGDFRKIITACVECGGDTDTVAAIAGGVAGAECGEKGIPAQWIERLSDWPRTVNHIRRVAAALVEPQISAPKLFWPWVLLRNVIFLLIVVGHGLARLTPFPLRLRVTGNEQGRSKRERINGGS